MTSGVAAHTHGTTPARGAKKGCGCGGGTRAGGCGCGGTGGCGGDCGKSSCACGGCERCLTDGFTRPRFFAGQLLTEEDLELLSAYTTAKNRLHNRYLFGQGVVCGLLVTCHPCRDGRVVVQPGYALDCCGNDILVPCATTLDVNAMLQELRRCGGDTDCVDPRKKGKTEAAGTAGSSKETVSNPATTSGAGREPGQAVAPTRYYCLYVRYCEEQTEPTAPYATDEPCGSQSCEWTRVRDGYRFELRCHECEPDRQSVLERMFAGFGDLLSAKRTGNIMRSLLYLGRTFLQGSAEPKEFTAGEIKGVADRLREETESARSEGANTTARRLWSVADAARETAGHVARFDALDEARRTELLAAQPELRDTLKVARHALGESPAAVPKEVLESRIDNAFDRMIILESVETAGKFADEGFFRGDRGQTVDPSLAERGITMARTELQTSVEELYYLREQLLERLDDDMTADCSLRAHIESIVLPSRTGSSDYYQTAAVEKASAQLQDALQRLILDRVCTAINPPCPPCEDPAVLLACFTVSDCKVQEICNMSRTFVLHGPALRHWLPASEIGDRLTRFCCPDDLCAPDEGIVRDASTANRRATGGWRTTNLRADSAAPFTTLNTVISTLAAVNPSRVRPEVLSVTSVLADAERMRATPLSTRVVPGVEPREVGPARTLDPTELHREVVRALDERLGTPAAVEATAFGREVLGRVDRKTGEMKTQLDEQVKKGVAAAVGTRSARKMLDTIEALEKSVATLEEKVQRLERPNG